MGNKRKSSRKPFQEPKITNHGFFQIYHYNNYCCGIKINEKEIPDGWFLKVTDIEGKPMGFLQTKEPGLKLYKGKIKITVEQIEKVPYTIEYIFNSDTNYETKYELPKKVMFEEERKKINKIYNN